MQWFDSVRTRLRLMLARRDAESRMDHEFRFHIEMEAEELMRVRGLTAEEARRQALAAFGGVEKHKGALRDGRGLAWLGGMVLDAKLGGRMLLKYPGLTLAGGLAIAVAIGVGAGWYDLMGKFMSPTIPLPEGDRLVVIETVNAVTNEPEARVARDFLEWRRDLRSLEELGAYRTETRNLIVGRSAPVPIDVAELTADAFATARVPPLRGRLLVTTDEVPGAPSVVVLGYDTWQRALGAREDVVGLVVTLGATPATVVGVMPKGFGYPFNHDGWAPLSLQTSYEALDGPPISVVGRLAPGVSLARANAELRAFAARTAAAFPASHEHLRPQVARFGEVTDFLDVAELVARNLPVLLVLAVACMNVGTLIYARTATREGEIAIRAALGAGRARIVGQLFIEALVLAIVSAAVGLLAVDRTLAWGIESVNSASGGAPFWIRSGLELTTILYAVGLAVVSAVLLSLLPALRVTRANLQPHLANLGSGRATLRFGRVWTAAMIAQVALTAMCIPGAMESTRQTMHKVGVRARFPSREFLAARVDLERPLEEATSSADERRTATFAALASRLALESGVVAVTFADGLPGGGMVTRHARVETAPGAEPVFDDALRTLAVEPGFFDTLARPIVAGRAFNAGDRHPTARTVIVNEAFARGLSREAGVASPIGARLRYRTSPTGDAAGEPSYEIVGVVRDIGLDPDDEGHEQAEAFHAASTGAMSRLVMSVRMRGNPDTLAARLPVLAANVDARLLVQDARSMEDWVRDRDTWLMVFLAAELGVTALVLFLSALGIFSLVSVGVSRRTREIGLRVSLGATRWDVISRIVSRAMGLMGTGIVVGSGVLLLALWRGLGPSGHAVSDIALFAPYLGMTSIVMLVACLAACVAPTLRALRISPSEALRES